MKILKTGKLSPEGVCLDNEGTVIVFGSNEVLIFEGSEGSED